MLMSPRATLVATASAVGIALVFGSYPAHRATALEPIDALRAD